MSKNKAGNNIKGFIYVFLFSISWAIDAIIAKLAYKKGADPFVFSYQTLLLASFLMIGYTFILKNKSSLKLTKKDIPLMIFLGFLANGVGTAFEQVGLKLSFATNYGFIIKTATFFVVIFAFLILKEKISFKKMILLFCLLLGSYFISTKGESLIPALGDIFIISAALCFALVAVLSKKIINRNSAEFLSFFRLFSGGFTLFTISLILGKNILNTLYFFYMLIDSVFRFLLILFLYKTIEIKSASYMTMMSMMFSVFVAVFSYFIFGETMNLVQILGAIMIIGSVVLIQKSEI
ncbi:DMT family transporter [Candidatus Woesearchaeota archaeon]|nr:DMT family transporter [Candidatus Woesearchaeota archaeon]